MEKTFQFEAGKDPKTVCIPPSKSVAHRAIICAGLALGESEVQNLSDSQDITATKRCMEILKNLPDDALLDCGESGTTLRLLIPVAALFGKRVRFTGHGRLMERPLTPYMNELGKHGVNLQLEDGVLTVSGKLQPGNYELPGDISSQFVSGLLLALPLLAGDSVINLTTPLESASYVSLTLDCMEQFGVTVRKTPNGFAIDGGQHYQPRTYFVESDYSQAAFFLAASALGRHYICEGLNAESLQGDKKIVEIIKACGASIVEADNGLLAKAEKLTAATVDVSDIPDLVPPLAALLSCCEGTSRIVGAKRLRLKESDRLATVASELNKLGANIVESEDSLTIHGVKRLKGGIAESHNDHRIAMMCAVASVRCESPVVLSGAECVAKSYPNFWEDFA